MTENKGYQTPEKGTADWHIPLNENFEQLDRDIEIRDHESNRGNYIPKTGAKYFATDTGAIFLGDGSEWQHVGRIPRMSGDIYVQDTEPSEAQQGDLWVDTS